MKLVIATSIKKTELEPVRKIFGLDVIKMAAKKSLSGLGSDIKNSTKIPNTLLKKVYLTSTGGAGRAVFLLQISSERSILIMIKQKNDKQIGENMTVKNPRFQAALDKNLDLVLSDLESGNFEEYEL